MKIIKFTFINLLLLLVSLGSYSQDRRTIETKVADLLARLPAQNNEVTQKLMGDMLLLGENGINMICDLIIPAGTGDDTGARFAVECFSRFLSGTNKQAEKLAWEKTCITYVQKREDSGVKDFFMKQLQLIGGDQSIEAVKVYLLNKNLCEPAIAVIVACGGKTAESVLAESLRNKDLPCAATVMNALAAVNSQTAVNEYISWAADRDINVRTSALNALAQSGSPLAYPVLSKAAEAVLYRWESTGATEALLNYAGIVAKNGDIKTMDKICKLVMKKCVDDGVIQNKSAALGIYTKFHGMDAMPLLLKAAEHENNIYRSAAMRYSLGIPGSEVVTRWTAYFKKAIPQAKPEIIAMLGVRGDKLALPLVTSALSDENPNVRKEASEAVVRLGGKESLNSLINYLLVFKGADDQAAAKQALMTIISNDNIKTLLPVLKEGSPASKKTVMEILAWNKDNKYFTEVFPFTSSDDEVIKGAAIKALSGLADQGNLQQLIDLLSKTDKQEYISDIQEAIAVAANKLPDPEKRSDLLIHSLKNLSSENTGKIIPVLSKTGGREALDAVMNSFQNGTPEIKDVSFKSLTGWRDYSASSALYTIISSGNEKYEDQAFSGYIRQVRSADVPDEQKLLLLRKIMPFAGRAEKKNAILNEVGRLKTFQSLLFVANYLDDPSTSPSASRAAMNIALPAAGTGNGMYGDIVKQILGRVKDKLAGEESDYNREMINKYLAGMTPGEGYKPMFNGKDLSGWQGLVEDPVKRAAMKPAELAKKQKEADKKIANNWAVRDGCIVFNGSGDNLCSIKEYGDFEMIVDWKISKEGDSGIYLRGTPQVQIWDTSRVEVGAQVGSGGLYNNQKNPSKPLKVADNPVGDWNTFRILMTGEKVSVWLNGELVVDNVTLENYWKRDIPIFPKGAIELQAHGTDLAFRDIYIREISEDQYNLTGDEVAEGFTSLFNGRNLDKWTGNKEAYTVEDGTIVVKPGKGSGGNLYTSEEYADFVFRFEFQLTPAANNGLGIRAPLTGDAAYVGMELQILDDTAPVYANLQPYQYHGSVYGVIPSKRGYQNPVGEWNYEEVTVKGTQVKVVLNGTTIVDGDIAGPRDNGTMDHNEHPGLKNTTGHIGFLGHGSELKFRNIRIRNLSE